MKSDYEKGYELWQKVHEKLERRERRRETAINILKGIGLFIGTAALAVAGYYFYIAMWAIFG